MRDIITNGVLTWDEGIFVKDEGTANEVELSYADVYFVGGRGRKQRIWGSGGWASVALGLCYAIDPEHRTTKAFTALTEKLDKANEAAAPTKAAKPKAKRVTKAKRLN